MTMTDIVLLDKMEIYIIRGNETYHVSSIGFEEGYYIKDFCLDLAKAFNVSFWEVSQKELSDYLDKHPKEFWDAHTLLKIGKENKK